jgi:opacity protein-like surface antigen
MRKISLFLLALCAYSILPDAVYAQGGTSAVPFLLIAPTSRASGMGELGTAVADDASAIFWNPAGLGFQKGSEASITHANWLPQFHLSDLFYDYANFKTDIPEWGGTVAASITYLNLGEFTRTLESGPEAVGTFNAFDYAVTAGYGTKVTDDLALGMNLRFINSRLSDFGTGNEKGSGVAYDVSFDLGVLYRPKHLTLPLVDEDLGEVLSLGMSLSNIGPKVTYIDQAQADPLPTQLRLGIGIVPFKDNYNSLTVTADFARLLINRKGTTSDPVYKALITSWTDPGFDRVMKSFTSSVGMEYWYDKTIAIRAGYFYEDPDNGNRKFTTFGAGIRYEIYGFDFSYIYSSEETSPLSDTLRFTLLILWN